jgi:hypothetical protein
MKKNPVLCADIIFQHVISRGPLDWLYVSKETHARAMRLLYLDTRVDFTYCYQYPIQWAAAHGYDTVVECLLRHTNVKPSITAYTCYDYTRGNARTQDEPDYATIFEHERDYLNKREVHMVENESLVYAINAGHVSVVERLLAHDTVDPSGFYDLPLYFALRMRDKNDRRKVIEMLLSHPRFRRPQSCELLDCVLKYLDGDIALFQRLGMEDCIGWDYLRPCLKDILLSGKKYDMALFAFILDEIVKKIDVRWDIAWIKKVLYDVDQLLPVGDTTTTSVSDAVERLKSFRDRISMLVEHC